MKGWEDAHQQVPHRVDIKENVNRYAYEIGIIDFVFGFDMAMEGEVIANINKKLKQWSFYLNYLKNLY